MSIDEEEEERNRDELIKSCETTVIITAIIPM